MNAPNRGFSGRFRSVVGPMFGFAADAGAEKFGAQAAGQPRVRKMWDEEAQEWYEEEIYPPPPPLTPQEKLANAPLVATGLSRVADFIGTKGGPKWLRRIMPQRLVVALQSGLSTGTWELLQEYPMFATIVMIAGSVGDEEQPQAQGASEVQPQQSQEERKV